MNTYLDKKIKVSLPNGYFYVGNCIKHDGDIIIILDREGKEVLLNLKHLVSLEVLEWDLNKKS